MCAACDEFGEVEETGAHSAANPLLEKQRETIKSQRKLLLQKEKEINLLRSTVEALRDEKDEV